jgi:two-component system NarL family sensor kinase
LEIESEVRFWFGIITVMLAFVLITGGFILIMIRYQKRLLLKQQELLKLDAQHKQELLLSSIRSAEEQRLRIAREVHDEIGSIFSTLSLSVNRLSAGDAQQAAHIDTSRGLIQSGINSVRRISHAIVPFELELLGLEQTLENHFETLRSLSGIGIGFENAADIDKLGHEASLAVYRIVQELCANCLKHAGATAMSVKIFEYPGSLHIVYTDNGCGFSKAASANGKGIGLRNIESRVLLLNGSSEFVCTSGSGFSCSLVIPLPHNTNA